MIQQAGDSAGTDHDLRRVGDRDLRLAAKDAAGGNL
jgi:hypothetical protein